jgi:hypothetical protein
LRNGERLPVGVVALVRQELAEGAEQHVPGELGLGRALPVDDVAGLVEIDALLGRHPHVCEVFHADFAQNVEHLALGDEAGAPPLQTMHRALGHGHVEAGAVQQHGGE